jgi:hypothetical protein
MIRTQIQLTPEQMRGLKAVAARRGRPVAELVREGVDEVLRQGAAAGGSPRERAAAVSGRFRSGLTDLARRHDTHLAESLAE